MLKINGLIGVLMLSGSLFAGSLPVILSHPGSLNLSIGANALLSVTATNATGYQWRFNGTDIPGATHSSLQLTNFQSTNFGYYLAIATNDVGWVPSQMAYLHRSGTTFVPFSNTNAQQVMDIFLSGGANFATAHLVVGKQLDQMKRVPGASAGITNGYYIGGTPSISIASSGEEIYYRVEIEFAIYGYTNRSTTLKIPALPTQSLVSNLKFPAWPEWPEPTDLNVHFGNPNFRRSPTNEVRTLGETFSITNIFIGYADFGIPTWQWRKDGTNIGTAQSFVLGNPLTYEGIAVLTITNAQPKDAGIYDVVVLGNDRFIGRKTTVSIQQPTGFTSTELNGNSFIAELPGLIGRNYAIDRSSDFSSWTNVVILSNSTGVISFTNSPTEPHQFFRARLLP
jgi:hypothetical protein